MSDASAANAASMGLKRGGPQVTAINNIQAMRGIASLIVFIGHALLLQSGLGLDRYFPYFGVMASSGVDVFFVISGFIITTVAMRNGGEAAEGRARAAWNFGIKRVTRIYPVYWVVFCLAYLLTPWINFAPPVTDIKPVVEQFFLTTHINSYIMSAWSLCFEIYFYAVVTIAIFISPRNVGKVLAAWAVGITVLIAYDYFIGQRGWIGNVPMSPMILEFVMGMVVAYVLRKGYCEFAVTAAFIGLVTFIVGLEIMRSLGWSTLNPWYRTFYSGIPSAFIIYAIVALEYKGIWTFSKFWVKLGDASYSIYVWHQFIYYSILAFVTHEGWLGKVPTPILLTMWMAPAFVFGLYSYKHIELPIQKKLNGWLLIRKGSDASGQGVKRVLCVSALLSIVLVVSGFSYVSGHRTEELSKEMSPLGLKISSGMKDVAGMNDIDSAAKTAGLQYDGAVRGHFDGVYRLPRDIRVHGWAVDTRSDPSPVNVLVFFCGRFMGLAPRGEGRPDVESSLKVADGRSGFTTNFRAGGSCSSSQVLALLVTKDHRYSTISARF